MAPLPTKAAELADLLNISPTYAHLILKTERPWTRSLAISAYRKTGVKVGPIAEATDDEIDVLERFERERAA